MRVGRSHNKRGEETIPDREPFLRVLRPFVEAYFAFRCRSDRHIRGMGLTSPQFDILTTLGDTEGMTCGELSEKTLVTKGTLTGVLDRLEDKGLIERVPSQSDRRSIRIQLTSQGEKRFRKVFPLHIGYMKPYFNRVLTQGQMQILRETFLLLKNSFEQDYKEKGV